MRTTMHETTIIRLALIICLVLIAAGTPEPQVYQTEQWTVVRNAGGDPVALLPPGSLLYVQWIGPVVPGEPGGVQYRRGGCGDELKTGYIWNWPEVTHLPDDPCQ